jgi:exodeoxyribonuclease-3
VLLATWNVNGIRARSQRLTEFLAEKKPDVLCLQELKITDDEFPFAELEAAGYHAVIHGQAGWNGVAVIAREPPKLVLKGLPGRDEDGARFVVARVHDIDVCSVYVPNGKSAQHPDYKMKLAWLDVLAKHVEARADKDAPLVLGGDFNVCWTALDSFGGIRFDGKVHHTVEERALLDRLHAAGLVDLYRSKYPEEPGYSWWDYRAGSFHKKEGMRIDLLLATAAVADRVEEVRIEREFRKKGKPSGSIPSDHAPVVAVLR